MKVEKRTGRHCDYCNMSTGGESLASGFDSSRDMCKNCVNKAYKLFNSSFSNTMADVKDTLKLAFKKEPAKTFRKLGLIDGDDILTDDGVKLYLSWKFQADQEKFYEEVAKPLLEEQEKESKK